MFSVAVIITVCLTVAGLMWYLSDLVRGCIHCWHRIGPVTRTIDHGSAVPVQAVTRTEDKCCKCEKNRRHRPDLSIYNQFDP